MTDDLHFMMGKFAARVPSGLRYGRNHMWGAGADGRVRFGFTSYAVRLMQDVYFLDWCVDEGTAVALKQRMGNIETSKAVSDLFAPIAGTVERINHELLKDPSGINFDNYSSGWLFEMTGDDSVLMDAASYHTFLESGWETTQRLLKGQVLKD